MVQELSQPDETDQVWEHEQNTNGLHRGSPPPHSGSQCHNQPSDESPPLQQQVAELEQQLAASQQRLKDERSRRLSAEHALHRSETMFRTLIERNRDPILVVHNDTVRHINAAAEELLGRSARDLVGESVGILIADEYTEVDVPGRQGVRVADMHVVDVEWEGERVAMASLRDVTAYKRMAEALQQANALLEQRVYERTAELQHANDALRASEARFRTVADCTYDWECWLAPDGTCRYVSPSCERITGYPPQAFDDPDLLMHLVHPDDREMHAQHVSCERSETDDCDHQLEFRIITRDGNERWIGHVCQPVYDDAGQPAGRRTSNRDITEQKSAEIALRNANELLEMLFSSIHIHVAYMDAAFNFIRVNTAYAAADGKTPDFFAGKNHFDLYPNAENEALFRRVVATGQVYTVFAKAFRYLNHPERGTTYWDWTLYPVKNRHGTVETLILSLVNVTERIEAEEAYRILVEHTRQGLVIVQSEALIFANQAIASITGYHAEHLRTMTLEEIKLLLHPDERELLLKCLGEQRMGKAGAQAHEFRIIRSNGEVRWLEATFVPITYRGRASIQITCQDVTENKRAREAYRTLVDHSLQGLAILQDEHIVFANHAMADMLGYRVEELLFSSPETMYGCIHPDDRPRAQHSLCSRQAGQPAPARYELRMLRKDGSVCTVEVSAVGTTYRGQNFTECIFSTILIEWKYLPLAPPIAAARPARWPIWTSPSASRPSKNWSRRACCCAPSSTRWQKVLRCSPPRASWITTASLPPSGGCPNTGDTCPHGRSARPK